MMVLLEREDGKYSAGETVRGRVHIILTQDVNVTGPSSTHFALTLSNSVYGDTVRYHISLAVLLARLELDSCFECRQIF